MNIRFQSTALHDLKHIKQTIAVDNARAAENTILRIDQSISLLEKFPRIGRPGSVPGTREISVPNTPYIVIYSEPDEFEIWILSVVHERQRYPPEHE